MVLFFSHQQLYDAFFSHENSTLLKELNSYLFNTSLHPSLSVALQVF